MKISTDYIIEHYGLSLYGKDIVFIPYSDSDELIIIMSTRNQKQFMGIKNFFKKRKTNLLFLKNPENNYYFYDDYGKTTNKILKYYIDKFDERKVTLVGSSMSGYSAIYFGIKNNVNILVSVPQINLNQVLKNDEVIWKSLRKIIHKMSPRPPNLELYMPNNIKDSIIYIISGNFKIDNEQYDVFIKESACVKLLEYSQVDYKRLKNENHKWFLGSPYSLIRMHKQLISKRKGKK